MLLRKDSPPLHLQAKLWASSPAIRAFEVQEAALAPFPAKQRERERARERGREIERKRKGERKREGKKRVRMGEV